MKIKTECENSFSCKRILKFSLFPPEMQNTLNQIVKQLLRVKSCEIRAAFSLKVEIKKPENDTFDV